MECFKRNVPMKNNSLKGLKGKDWFQKRGMA